MYEQNHREKLTENEKQLLKLIPRGKHHKVSRGFLANKMKCEGGTITGMIHRIILKVDCPIISTIDGYFIATTETEREAIKAIECHAISELERVSAVKRASLKRWNKMNEEQMELL
jgi:hypothetical protein